MSTLTSPRIRTSPFVAAAPGIAKPLLRVNGLTKSYRRGSVTIPVLRGVDLAIPEGEFLAIVGQSGSGKSTLLHLLATLDVPDGGEIRYEENRIDNLAPRGRDVLRNQHFGMVFQFYHLLPELSALENVILPSLVGASLLTYFRRREAIHQRGTLLLEQVGLSHRATHRPAELSGGEMQRVAIARALMAEPRILFADEPTGNLDREAGEGILGLLRALKEQSAITIVMVTHDQEIADSADRTVRLAEGRVVGNTWNTKAT